MSRAALDRHTLRNHRRWTVGAIVFAAASATAPAIAGGADPWFRWLTGLVTVAGAIGACRFKNTLHVPMAAALTGAALLPDDARIDPSVVAAVSAIAMLLCAESVAVARRLVTAASVRSTGADVRAVALLALLAVGSVLCVGVLAQLDRWGGRALIVGLPLAAAAVVAAVAGRLTSPPSM